MTVTSRTKKASLLGCFVLEVTVGFEPTDNGVADRGLTTWLRHHTTLYVILVLFVKTTSSFEDVANWSGLRGSNPPPQPWQGCALPNELNPRVFFLSCPDSITHVFSFVNSFLKKMRKISKNFPHFYFSI